MASSSSLMVLSIVIGILSISASARPCKTFFISSYSFSIKPLYPNPNHPNPSGFVTIVTEINRQSSSSSSAADISFDRRIFPAVDRDEIQRHQQQRQQDKASLLPFGLSSASYDMSSLRDRTMDILSVVVALLFGVGCGALTAATMYLVWSLFTGYRSPYLDEFDSDDNEDDDVSLKKIGYMKIPEADSVVKPAKEVV